MVEKSDKKRSGGPRKERPRSKKPRRSRSAATSLEVIPVSKHLRSLVAGPLATGSYIVFDIETTGGNPSKNGITEICALRYQNGQVTDKFYSMVDPKIPIPPIVRKMTGISNQMVRGQPTIDKVMPGFLDFIGKDILVSHNTIGDMKFVRYFANQVGVQVDNFFLCTHLLVEKLAAEAPNKSLTGLAEHFAISFADLHRAEADAQLNVKVFEVFLEKLATRGVRTIESAIRLQGDYESALRLGWKIPEEKLASLPEKPGVFYLRDEAGQVSFFSSAMNLKRDIKKLQKHAQLPRQMLKLVLNSHDLDVEPTSSQFAAMAKECCLTLQGKYDHCRFQAVDWHQRNVQAICLSQKKTGVRLTLGPCDRDTYAAFGPINDRKEAKRVVEELAELCGRPRKPSKGFVVPPSLVEPVEAALSGRLRAAVAKTQSSRQHILNRILPRRNDHIKERIDVLAKLSTVNIKALRLKPLLEVSGYLAIDAEAASGKDLYVVRNGQVQLKKRGVDVDSAETYAKRVPLKSRVLLRWFSHGKRTPIGKKHFCLTSVALWWIHSRSHRPEGSFFGQK